MYVSNTVVFSCCSIWWFQQLCLLSQSYSQTWLLLYGQWRQKGFCSFVDQHLSILLGKLYRDLCLLWPCNPILCLPLSLTLTWKLIESRWRGCSATQEAFGKLDLLSSIGCRVKIQPSRSCVAMELLLLCWSKLNWRLNYCNQYIGEQIVHGQSTFVKRHPPHCKAVSLSHCLGESSQSCHSLLLSSVSHLSSSPQLCLSWQVRCRTSYHAAQVHLQSSFHSLFTACETFCPTTRIEQMLCFQRRAGYSQTCDKHSFVAACGPRGTSNLLD